MLDISQRLNATPTAITESNNHEGIVASAVISTKLRCHCLGSKINFICKQEHKVIYEILEQNLGELIANSAQALQDWIREQIEGR